jgi:hypothetical protein
MGIHRQEMNLKLSGRSGNSCELKLLRRWLWVVGLIPVFLMAQHGTIIGGSVALPTRMTGIHYFRPLTPEVGWYLSFRTTLKGKAKKGSTRNYIPDEGGQIPEVTEKYREYFTLAGGITYRPKKKITAYLGMTYTEVYWVERFQYRFHFGLVTHRRNSHYRFGFNGGVLFRWNRYFQFLFGMDTYPTQFTVGIALTLPRQD